MALLYVDEHSASLDRATVATGETIKEGEFVFQQSNGDLRKFDPANDALPHGIVVHDPEGDSIAEHDEDYFANYDDLWTYTEGDNPYYQPLASVDSIRPQTIDSDADANGATPPEPSISEGVVVGIVNINGETRIVESGYTHDIDGDGTAETFSESGAGDFVSIGRVNKQPQQLKISSAYDQRVPIRLDADEFTA